MTVWKTKEGRELEIVDIGDAHLYNILKLIDKRIEEFINGEINNNINYTEEELFVVRTVIKMENPEIFEEKKKFLIEYKKRKKEKFNEERIKTLEKAHGIKTQEFDEDSLPF